jgi:hypothetical protein
VATWPPIVDQITSLAAPDPVPLVERGLAVFPLPRGAKAAPAGWQHTVTNDLERIRATWPYGANIGIGCRASGIVGIDLDRHTTGGNARADGVAGFAQLCARWKQKRPVTLEIRTAHDGRHLLFRVPARVIVPSVSGGTSRLGPGIDIRGPGRTIGSYLVGAGSVVDNRRYTIEVDEPISVLPAWLSALIGRRGQSGPT